MAKNKKKSILLIQFRTDASFLHERMCYYSKLLNKDSLDITIINAFDEDVQWGSAQKVLDGHDGVILGGSGEFHFPGNGDSQKQQLFERMLRNMEAFVPYLLENDFPTLGVCFGHQLIGFLLGTYVRYDKKQAKTGSYMVWLTKEGQGDPLYKGFPKKFLAQYAHKDSLPFLPEGAVLLAYGKQCDTAAFRYNQHIYGVQFHPEMSISDMLFRLKMSSQEYLPGSLDEAKKRICDAKISQKILDNFIANIQKSHNVL